MAFWKLKHVTYNNVSKSNHLYTFIQKLFQANMRVIILFFYFKWRTYKWTHLEISTLLAYWSAMNINIKF